MRLVWCALLLAVHAMAAKDAINSTQATPCAVHCPPSIMFFCKCLPCVDGVCQVIPPECGAKCRCACPYLAPDDGVA